MTRKHSEAFVVPGQEIEVDWNEAIPLLGFGTAALTDVYGNQETGEEHHEPVIGLWLRSHMGSIVTSMPTQGAEALIAKLQDALLEHSDESPDDIANVTGLIIPDFVDPDRKHDDG